MPMLCKETNEMSFTSHYKNSETVYGDNVISNCKNVIHLLDKDKIKRNAIKGNVSHHKHFVLCESCFWCVTCLVAVLIQLLNAQCAITIS